MKIGILGTGAIAHKHVQAYQNIGWQVTACHDTHEGFGRAFAAKYGGVDYGYLSSHPRTSERVNGARR